MGIALCGKEIGRGKSGGCLDVEKMEGTVN